MGRFYKTAKPNMIDFMYQVPEQAILGAIKGADAQLEKQEQFLTDFQKQLKLQALDPDIDRQKELLKQYEDQIKEYSLKISSNPLDALKQKQGIRELGNKLYQDVTRGELGAQYGNYAARQKHLEEETKRATSADGSIKEEDLAKAMAEFDRRYAAEKRDEKTGELIQKGGINYDPATGKYRTYGAEKLVDYFKLKEEFAKTAEGWKPSTDTDITTERIFGDYYVTTRNKDKILPLDELTKGVYNTALFDPRATNYYDQQIRILGGGNPNKELAWFNYFYGERADPGNKFSPFAMTEVKDQEGKTKMQTVQGRDGKTKEVPVMEMKNAGYIFQAAQAAASKQDINEIVRSKEMDMTEQAEANIRIAEDETKALNKKIREESTFLDTNNNDVEQLSFSEQTHDKITDSIESRRTNLNSIIDNAVVSYAQIIKTLNPNEYSADQRSQMADKIAVLAKGRRWDELQEYIKQNKLAGVQGIGTGIKELAAQSRKIETDIKNEELIFTDLKQRVKDNFRVDGVSYSQKYDQISDRLESAKRNKRLDLVGDYEKDLLDLRKALGKAYNDEIQKTSSNTKTVYISNGNSMEGTVKKDQIQRVNNILINVAKNFLGQIPDGTEAVVVQKGKSTAVNLNELLKNNNIDLEEIVSLLDPTQKIYDVFGKPKTFKVLSAGIAHSDLNVPIGKDNKTGLTNFRNIGENALAVEMLLNDPKTNKPVNTTIYIPKNEFSNKDYDEAVELLRPSVTSKNFADNAKLKIQNQVKEGADPEKLYQESEKGVKYYPYSGTGKWVFPNGKTLYGREGEVYNADIYEQ